MSFEPLCAGLASDAGFSFLPGFLSDEELSALGADFERCRRDGLFRRAAVGKELQIRDDIRRDETLWFEQSQLSDPQRALWDRLENLRAEMNSSLFLGLWEFEGHYAFYGPGGFYERHLDRFHSDDARTVSIVLYLNQGWRPGDGGELRLFTPTNAGFTDVEPRGGTIVTFLSDRIEHAVLPSRIDRRSFAGWFKRRVK